MMSRLAASSIISEARMSRIKFAFVQCYALSSIFMAVFHIGLGSDPEITAILSLISVSGSLFLLSNSLRYTDIFMFLFSIYSGYAALLMKAILMQPLQQNLMAPTDSARYLFIGYTSILMCAVLANAITKNRRMKIGDAFDGESFRRTGLFPLIISGIVLSTAHIILQYSFDFGGLGAIAAIASLSYALLFKYYATSTSPIKGHVLAAVTLAIFCLAIFTNTKRSLLGFIIIGALSAYAFRIRIKFSIAASSVLAALIVVMVLSPIIHLMRNSTYGSDPTDRFLTAYQIAADNGFSIQTLMSSEEDFFMGFDMYYTPGGMYNYPDASNISRFALIFSIDRVARALDREGVMGMNAFLRKTTETILPSAIISKTKESSSDLVGWNYGFLSRSSIGRPVVGFVATSLAASGIIGVIIFPWLIALPVLSIMNYVFGPIENRSWGVYGFGVATLLLEYSISEWMSFPFRNILFAVVPPFFFLLVFSKLIVFRRRIHR